MKDIEKNNEAFKALALVSRRIAELETENDQLKAENAKLRELVEDMWAAFAAKGRLSFADRVTLVERMLALGVEVDA